MTEPNLHAEWAWTQIEAWADDSLSPENRARMAAAVAADPRLAAAVERARAVRAALRATSRAPMPRGLRGRLLAIPSREPRARAFARPAFAGAAAALVVAGVAAVAISLRSEPPVQPDPRAVAAAQDLEIAMRYLQQSARVTQARVTTAVGTGLRDAFAATREAIEKDTDETGG